MAESGPKPAERGCTGGLREKAQALTPLWLTMREPLKPESLLLLLLLQRRLPRGAGGREQRPWGSPMGWEHRGMGMGAGGLLLWRMDCGGGSD